jgi:hypothetical protein
VTVSDGINPPVISPPVDIPIIPQNDAGKHGPYPRPPWTLTRSPHLDFDVDATQQVTLSVANGTLQVRGDVGGGLTAAGITGNGTASVVLTGTLAEINATLCNRCPVFVL